KSMESYELKNALDAIFFEFMKDLERGLDKNLKNDQVMKEWLKTLCPFIPFTCERLWKKLGGVGLISKQRLPELKKEKIDLKIEQLEDIVFGILEDLETIKKLTKIEKPKKIRIFVAEDWKRKAINEALEIKDLKVLMKELMSLDDMKAQGKKGAEFANWIVKHFDKIKKVLVSESEEKEYLEKNKEYLEKKTGAEVEIILSKESDSLRAGKSIPLKPAIEVV
ncbi:MAG: class I tRNA ligase family protein, partial [archaeon]